MITNHAWSLEFSVNLNIQSSNKFSPGCRETLAYAYLWEAEKILQTSKENKICRRKIVREIVDQENGYSWKSFGCTLSCESFEKLLSKLSSFSIFTLSNCFKVLSFSRAVFQWNVGIQIGIKYLQFGELLNIFQRTFASPCIFHIDIKSKK